MQIQVRTDKHTEGGERFVDFVQSYVKDNLDRYGSRITAVELHFADENGDKNKSADDKRCSIEVRLAGANPLALTHYAGTVDEALRGAVEKIRRMITEG